MNVACMRLAANPHNQNILNPGVSPLTQCLQATEASIGAFLSTDPSRYASYPTTNWCRLIHTVITAFSLLSAVNSYPNVSPQTATEIMRFDRYLELLRLRMQERSTTDLDDPSAVPDYYCLWSSVLRVANDKYRELAAETQQAMNVGDESANVFQVNSAICPVMNGSLRQTEYWGAWSSSGASQYSNIPVEDSFGMAGTDFGFLLNGQDWTATGTGWENLLFDGDWAQNSQPSSTHGF